ncbi:MAG: thioredoxin family protein [Chloroflexota bacterium]|nr:thioredoxin family protein [Chloroflexota bacterium]
MTYPSDIVHRFIVEHFVPVRLLLNQPEHRAHFRQQRVIWTPTIVILDWRGRDHYRSLGYLPPDLFAHLLHIGLARAKMAWARYDEAASHLHLVANQSESPLAPEALYQLGMARYLQTRRHADLMEPWDRLLEQYPDSIWAARVPPNQSEVRYR